MLFSCSVGAAPVCACSSSALEFSASSAYQVPWYSSQDFLPSLIMLKSRFCPAMPRLMVMFTAVGSLALAPSAWNVTPCESSALAVGSVIFAVSPWTLSARSAVNAALFTVAILASLSLTIWSADWPEAAVAAAELAVDASSPLPPHPTATRASASTSNSSSAPRLGFMARMVILLSSSRRAYRARTSSRPNVAPPLRSDARWASA